MAVGVGVGTLLWVGAAGSSLLSGHRAPRGHLGAVVLAIAHPLDPSAAWWTAVGPAPLYWSVTAAVLAVGVAVALAVRRVFGGTRQSVAIAGLAGRDAIRRAAGRRQLARRAVVLRPGLERPSSADLGYRLGSSRGVECWMSVEDSLVVLGPPRSGKGLHTVVPAILDAPGAVVTTSTRPDNLTATMRARSRLGPVAVFDPQGLSGLGMGARWSPINGCERPRVALARARALCADPGDGVEHGSFWSQQCLIAVRCLLHAAALDGRSAAEVYRWSLSPVAAQDAVDVLVTHPRATVAWGSALEAILASDPRQRDSTWSMVANVFAPLADPMVLEAVSPGSGEQFDVEAFLRSRGTIYLLGTASGASATATLVSALVDEITETARRLAAVAPGARLDPPVAVVLDEAANYPLPSLPALMSDGGGSGISTIVVLQSLAQARARWGADAAAAIWDAAIVRLVLGGSGSATDLRDLSALTGSKQQRRLGESRGPDGQRSVSTSLHDVPVLDVGDLRTLRFGTALLLLRSAAPIMLKQRPWTERDDAALLREDRAKVESEMRLVTAG
ncbi:MAG: type IV secretory system conjugative DNA transfer family protein [Jatrophihabitans sp.]|nr:MAG: type IV secretory system conjugative DNA transfer family protein [Jatrophihabitans sp.]